MIRPIEEIRRVADENGLTCGEIARACVPPLPPVTVWRVLKGKRAGHSTTHEKISAAIDSLMASSTAVASGEVVAQ